MLKKSDYIADIPPMSLQVNCTLFIPASGAASEGLDGLRSAEIYNLDTFVKQDILLGRS